MWRGIRFCTLDLAFWVQVLVADIVELEHSEEIQSGMKKELQGVDTTPTRTNENEGKREKEEEYQ